MDILTLNAKVGADLDERWNNLVTRVRDIAPAVLILQEVPHLAAPAATEAARAALGMDLYVAPSRKFNTAIAWNPRVLELQDTEDRYSTSDLHHGYALGQFMPLGTTVRWPAPLTAISSHLPPFSAKAGAEEAKILVNRAWRYGGIGIVGGDMNYLVLGDPEPDWLRFQPHNRVARCLPRTGPDARWIGDRAVGEVFRDGEMTDVAAHLADLRQDPGYRTPTGGGIRLDQFHVTPALRPAIVDYHLVDTGADSDHDGALVTLDLDLVSREFVNSEGFGDVNSPGSWRK
ncbi:hypothetical protein OG824_27695 [Streptomyces prunicolor]|uniref:hypothetical protein n=1 Tax=Streptomyces prunicolor TaxID=67348 RepID=UPI002250AAA6|nr:hypothetical protein [Streptomyces prunicolor]MCX5238989.1 hypothetical protein [Streptomyces prunicolor]